MQAVRPLRHSALGYLTLDEFEDLHSPQPEATLS